MCKMCVSSGTEKHELEFCEIQGSVIIADMGISVQISISFGRQTAAKVQDIPNNYGIEPARSPLPSCRHTELFTY